MVVVAGDRTRERVPGGGRTGRGIPELDRRSEQRSAHRSSQLRSAHHGWHPLCGNDLLDRLRVTGRRRPDVDPELAQRLRSGLEQGLLADRAGGGRPGGVVVGDGAGQGHGHPSTLTVTKDRLAQVLACEAHRVDTRFGDRTPSVAMACGALVDVLFRQLITVGSIGDPMADGLAALSVDDHHRLLTAWIERMAPVDRAELRAEVERQAEGLVRRWPALEASWFPRTQVAMRTRLAGGMVELSARADLVIGRPAVDQASVAIVEVKSGARWTQHRADLHFYALVETLRSGVPPFVVATYYTRTGELDVEPVTDDVLAAATRRTLIGTRSLLELHGGGAVDPIADRRCDRCAALPEGSDADRRPAGPRATDPAVHRLADPDPGTPR